MVKKFAPLGLGLACALIASMAMAAAQKSGAGHETGLTREAILIAQIALLLVIGRGIGEVMQRFGQPAVIGQLLAGLVLGPSLFGWVWPEAHDFIFPKTPEQKGLITGISNIGVMMLLLLTGMETDLKLVRKVGAPALAVTTAGVAVPFICGFTLGQFLPDSLLPGGASHLVASLFLGTALSISSIKIVAMVVREMNFMRRNLGQIIVASAIMEDTVGWIIIAITLGIAGAGGFAWGSLAKTVIGTALFLGFSYTLGRRWVFWLIRWVNDRFVSEYAVVTAILLVMCVMALITQAIGVNTVLGAFVAGVLVGESPILSKQIEDELRGFITAFMMPIFFGMSGLSADLTILKDPSLALLTLGLVAIASIGKFGGAFTGGMVSGLSARESLALGCGMNARGSTEVIVATIGLGMGALTQNLYTMIVTMAVLTTMAMPPMLRWALARLPLGEEEKARLEKEDIDRKGFVSQFERLLIAADESANGKFASRLAGFIAGQRGKPITVLQLEGKKTAADKPAEEKTVEATATALTEAATQGAEAGSRTAQADQGELQPDKVEVSTKVEQRKPDAAISEEAAKGYDLLFVGVEKMRNADGSFSINVDRAAKGFEGPLALTLAGTRGEAISAKGFNILIPVNGTESSRRGAELAMSLSPPEGGSITALHVAERGKNSNRRHSGRGPRARRRTQRALLDDLKQLAKRYGYENIRAEIRTDIAPEDAILDEAERVECSLIVIGASRRVGDTLYLGQTVAAVLQHWDGPLVLLAN